MKFLLIEDEEIFINRLKAVVEVDESVNILVSKDVGLNASFKQGLPVEDELLERLEKMLIDHQIDLVLLDTDLSRIGNGVGQTTYRQAFQNLGIPVCRYTKRGSDTVIINFKKLRRLAVEGASSVFVPGDKLRGADLPKLLPWMKDIHQGFSTLRERLISEPKLLTETMGPVDILAKALDEPTLKSDLLGYTAQNFFFFAAPEESQRDIRQNQATRLGYWLLNYILEFPGPILSSKAAAAFLNVKINSFENETLQNHIASARYKGPFCGLDQYYWRKKLLDILDSDNGDIAKAEALKDVTLTRVDSKNPESSAYLCIVSGKLIPASKAGPQPDWIPSGAQLARISQDFYDELGPMLRI
jgi:hypothetical protein